MKSPARLFSEPFEGGCWSIRYTPQLSKQRRRSMEDVVEKKGCRCGKIKKKKEKRRGGGGRRSYHNKNFRINIKRVEK